MRERELEKRLRGMAGMDIYGSRREYAERKEAAVRALSRMEMPERTTGGRWEFICSQTMMVRKRTWLLHGLWLAVLAVLAGCGYLERVDEAVYMAAAVASPVLALLSVEEVSRVYYKSMLEIECATKYSVRGVVLFRMCLMCAVDMLLLAAGMFGFHRYVGLSFLRIMLYGFTPFLLMCLMCLRLMKYVSGELLKTAGVAAAALLVLAAYAGGMSFFGIYGEQWLTAWCAILAAAAGALVYEGNRMGKRLGSFETL